MDQNIRVDWRYVVNAGLLAGLSVVYTAMIGMIATFSERDIVAGVVSLGELLIFAPALFAGFLVVRNRRSMFRPGQRSWPVSAQASSARCRSCCWC